MLEVERLERLRWRGLEVRLLGQLGRAGHEDPLGWRGWGGPQVDMMEGGRSGGRRGRSDFLALSEAQVVAQQGEDVGPEGAEGGEEVESSSFS